MASTHPQHRRVLQKPLDPLDEDRRIMPIDDSVIEAGRQVHHLAHDHLAVLDHDPFGDLVGTDDGDLGVVDDRRVDHPAQRAQRGDGDGRAAEFLALGRAVLGGARDAGDLQRGVVRVARLGVADHRNHQAVRGLGGDAQMDGVRELLEAVGEVAVIPEKNIDAATALAGSSPAYFFLVAEALVDAGVQLGLPRDVAEKLAAQAAAGSGEMLASSGRSATQLRAGVTSPGGTTAAAVRELEESGLRGAFYRAAEACSDKAKELG